MTSLSAWGIKRREVILSLGVTVRRDDLTECMGY